jgi:hypothetical protein
MNTSISEVSDEVLARLFFRRLWQGYDSGGFSVGRSLQSNLVEAYMSLSCLYSINEFELDLKDFAQEAEHREPVSCRQMILGNLDNLSVISSSDIPLLCIEALCVWYKIHDNERCGQGYIANSWEHRFIVSVCKIMPIPLFPFFKSDEDILKIWVEADKRITIKYSVGSDHPYFND